jgi:hypothetical protein
MRPIVPLHTVLSQSLTRGRNNGEGHHADGAAQNKKQLDIFTVIVNYNSVSSFLIDASEMTPGPRAMKK